MIKRGLLGILLVTVVILVSLTLPAKAVSAIALGNPANFNASPAIAVTSPMYGLDFSPYTGADVTQEYVNSLLSIVAPYTKWVRTYDTGDSGMVGPVAHGLGLKFAASAWLDTDQTNNEAEITNLIAIGQTGEADMLIVGSEVLLRGDLSESQLLAYINRVKQAVPGIPVATADVYSSFLAHPAVIAAIDYILPNYYPFWAGVSLSSAISWIDTRNQQLVSAAGGKPIIVSETGWPSGGGSKGNAVPSPANAVTYLQNFISWAKSKNTQYFYFEAFDEPWKAADEGSFAAFWGVWDKDANLKPGMANVFGGVATNSPPVANNDAYSTMMNTALSVPAHGVLVNDTDVDGNTLTAVLGTNPAHGTLALNTDGSFIYTPGAGFTGADSFTYAANDGTVNSNTAVVTITVTKPNTPPVAVNDAYSVIKGNKLSVASRGVLTNDIDVDGNTLTAVLVSNPSHGTLALNSNGAFTYTPATSYTGPDSFTYKASDGTAYSNIATVYITVQPLNATTIGLSSSLNPSRRYQTVTFTAKVSSSSGVPGGTVSFYDGSRLLRTVTLSNGTARWSTSFSTTGTHTIKAIYNGSSTYATSSASINEQVN